MMEDNKNNMDEFFKNSMDQFNEEPSSDVWTGVSSRLDGSVSSSAKFWNAFKKWIPYAIFLLLFGAYYFYASAEMSTLEKQLAQGLDSPSHLENAYISEQELQKLNTEIETLKLQLADAKNVVESGNLVNTTESNEAQNQILNSLQNQLANLQKALQQKSDALDRAEMLISEKDQLLAFYQAQIDAPQEAKLAENSKKGENSNIEGLKTLNHNNYLNYGTYLQTPHIVLIKENDLIIEKSDRQARYMVGPTIGAFNTLVSGSDNRNIGNFWGIRQEFRLAKNWSASNSLTIYNQHYTLMSDVQELNQEILIRYPVYIDDASKVKQIEIRNNYVDFAVGIKYNFNLGNKMNSFFVNPNVKGLLYLPQEFEYTLAQTTDLVSTRNRYVGYFGSGNLSIGFERRLANNRWLQVAIWGEQSFIPLGEENQYIQMYGVQASYLFGK